MALLKGFLIVKTAEIKLLERKLPTQSVQERNLALMPKSHPSDEPADN